MPDRAAARATSCAAPWSAAASTSAHGRFEGGHDRRRLPGHPAHAAGGRRAGQAARERRLQRAAPERARGHARARARHRLPLQPVKRRVVGDPGRARLRDRRSTASSTRSTSRRARRAPATAPPAPPPPAPPEARGRAAHARPARARPRIRSTDGRRPRRRDRGELHADEDRPSFFTRLLRGLDGLRRFLVNVLFFGLLAGLVIASLGGTAQGARTAPRWCSTPAARSSSSSRAVDPLERLVARSTGAGAMASETLLKDLVDALRLAKDDARIKAVYLDTNDMAGGGFSEAAGPARGARRLQEERQEGDRLRRRLRAAAVLPGGAGRRGVPAPRGHGADRGLRRATQLLQGGPRPLRDRDARLPRGRVQVGGRALPARRHVEGSRARCRSTPTATCGATGSRTWPRPARSRPTTSRRSSRRCPTACARRTATWRTLAKEAKLVDTLAPRDEVRKRLIALVGEDKEKHSFKQVGYATYLKAKGGDRSGAHGPGQGRGGGGGQGHDPRRHAARGHDRRRLDGAAAAARPRGRRRRAPWCCASTAPAAAPSPPRSSAASASSCARPASRSWSRWARWPPRAATGSRPRPTRSGRRPRRSRARSGSSAVFPTHPQAAREVLRHPHRRRRHHALQRRAATRPRRSTRRSPTSSSSRSTTATRTSSRASPRRAR